MRALLVLAGDPPDRAALDLAWPGWSADVGLVVAADAGAETAERLGALPDLVVGDLDSLTTTALARLTAAGVAFETSPVDKDESDAELAVRAALARGAAALTIVGGFGGRPDHLLATIGILALPELIGVSVELVDGATRLSLLRGPGRVTIAGRAGDLVSLLPFGPGVDGVTTAGLAWSLIDEPLPPGPSRGLSNVRVRDTAEVSVRTGLLLVIETVAMAAPSATLPG